MPKLTVWFVRTGLCYLVVGFSLGALLLANRGVPFRLPADLLLSLHIEFLLVGWLVQLALGVAFWILPRFRTGRERGLESLAWASYGLLNLGVIGAAVASTIGPAPDLRLLARATQGLATAVFALHAWPRVKAFGKQGGG